jgi:hypothetical protein
MKLAVVKNAAKEPIQSINVMTSLSLPAVGGALWRGVVHVTY